MSLEKTRVKVEVEGEAKAKADARRLEGVVDRVEAKAARAKRSVNELQADSRGLRARFGRLLDKAGVKVGADSLEVGAFQYGAGGFMVRDSFKRSLAGGANVMLATALVAGMARGTAATLGGVADVRDYLDDHPNANLFNATEQVAQNAGRAIREKIRSIYIGALQASPFNDVVQQFQRMFRLGLVGKLSTADGELYIDQGIAEFFGDLGPLDEAIKAQGEARAAFRAGQAQREQAASNRKKAAEEALAKIDEITERQLSGLKTDIYRPKDIRLNRKQNQNAQRLYDDVRRRRILRQDAAAREAVPQVLDGEGR
ncbi:MAG: hypothetical protein KDB90_14490 [Planctomycetes bacterium]|nr:hypothetical protein [Planctomycetota bacterium]